VDANYWVKPMESELESINSNKVWTLVKAPNNIIHISCIWFLQEKERGGWKC
jgi:hypothetical protein